jgi:glycosyltransferase involved in cell wall biosynthesis
MSSGVPVVATDNGGINDFINEENGIKIPLRDDSALAEALLKIIRGERKFDPQTIRTSVITKYGTAAFKQKMLDVYNGVLEQKVK